jgi:hypothetical protein
LFYDVQYGVLLYLQLFASGGVAQPQMQCKNGLKQFNGCMLHVYLWYKNDFFVGLAFHQLITLSF